MEEKEFLLKFSKEQQERIEFDNKVWKKYYAYKKEQRKKILKENLRLENIIKKIGSIIMHIWCRIFTWLIPLILWEYEKEKTGKGFYSILLLASGIICFLYYSDIKILEYNKIKEEKEKNLELKLKEYGQEVKEEDLPNMRFQKF